MLRRASRGARRSDRAAAEGEIEADQSGSLEQTSGVGGAYRLQARATDPVLTGTLEAGVSRRGDGQTISWDELKGVIAGASDCSWTTRSARAQEFELFLKAGYDARLVVEAGATAEAAAGVLPREEANPPPRRLTARVHGWLAQILGAAAKAFRAEPP
jgi:hypothetical protein